MGYNFQANPGQQEIINTGADRVTIGKSGVTSAAVALVSSNSTRRTVWLNNLGSTYVWMGASSNITPGADGINFGHLSPDSNVEVRDYRGPIYGVAGASVGASLGPCYVGTADIG